MTISRGTGRSRLRGPRNGVGVYLAAAHALRDRLVLQPHDAVEKRLIRGTALGAVALMRALPILEGHVRVDTRLPLRDAL